MTPKEALIQVKDLLSDPTKWTKGSLARDSTGKSVSAIAPEAVCFCAVGATFKVAYKETGIFTSGLYDAMVSRLIRAVSGDKDYAGVYNDSLTHQQLLAWIDRAIKE